MQQPLLISKLFSKLTIAVLVIAVVSSKSMQAQTLHLLHAFNSREGASSQASLIRDSAGNLYGTTLEGGIQRAGTVFKLDKAHTLTVLYTFTGYPDGYLPFSSLLRDSSGNLYGTTSQGGTAGVGTVFKIDSSGTERVLHSFNNSDGRFPHGDLARDKTGNLYGTTLEGGSSGNFGTIFKLDTTGKLTTLYVFTNTGDGSAPSGELVRDASGNLYGTCQSGTVYKLDRTGVLTVLHTFSGSDGPFPYGGLIADSAGNLYGTTSLGGTSNNAGTVFRVTKTTGAFTLLYSFGGKMAEGAGPDGTLARDAAGNLYGANVDGGDGCKRFQGCGTIWKLDINNQLTVLTNFGKGNQGLKPQGGVILDKAGNLYGTTSQGGSPRCGDCGTLFKITP